MSNIVLRTDVVNSTVIPGLTSVSDKIKTAQSKCSSLQSLLPSSFPNTAQVSKLSYSLNNSVSEVLAAKKTISQKVEYARNIESKHSSKTSSLLAKLGGAAGAIFGAASGGVLGAVAGGIIGSKVAEPIVKTGAKIAKGAVSAVKGLFTKVGNGIKKAATAIKNTGAKVVKGFVSGAKKVVSSVGSGIKKAASAIKNTGAKIVKGFVSGVKKVGKAVSDGIKKVGAKVCKAVKSFAGGVKKVVSAVGSGIKKVGNFLKNTGAKVVKGFVSGVKKVGKAIGDGLKWAGGKIAQGAKAIAGFATKAAKGIWNGLKAAGKWVWNGLKKVGATIANVVVSVVEGLVSFVEAVGDFVVLALGAVGTVFTGFADIVRGIATGEWDWASTSALWKKGVLPVVAYNWTDKAFSALYETKVFKAIENNAAGWAKRDGGLVYSIGKGVGYYVGVIVVTAFTCGAGGVATAAGNFAVTAAVSGAAELGKATQSNYNSTIDKNIVNHYAKQEMAANPNLTQEQAVALAEENLSNGVYSDVDSVKKYQMDNISGSDVGKVMLASTSQAVVEGVVTGVLRTKIPTGATGASKFAKGLSTVQNFGVKGVKGVGKAGVQFTKAYVKEGTTVIVDGDYDVKKATVDGTASAITEVANAHIGFKNMKKWATSNSSAKTPVADTSSGATGATNPTFAGADSGATSETTEVVKKTVRERIIPSLKDAGKEGAKKIPERIVKDTYKNSSKELIVSPIVELVA